MESLTNQLLREIQNRFQVGSPVKVGEVGRGLQYIGELQLGWECFENYRLHRMGDHVMVAITNPATKTDRYLVAYFQPDDQKPYHPRLMRRFVKAGAQGVLILNPQVDEPMIREQILLHFIRWQWDTGEELVNQFCEELHIPHWCIAMLQHDKKCRDALRLRLAQKLMAYWADPRTHRSYPAFKKFSIEQILREDPDLIPPPHKLKTKRGISKEAPQMAKELLATAGETKGEKGNTLGEPGEENQQRGQEDGPIIKESKSWSKAVKNAQIAEEGLSVQEVAERIGTTRKSIYKWVREGRLQSKDGILPLRIPKSEMPKATALGMSAGSRTKNQDQMLLLITHIAKRDDITPRSARRKLERWKKTEYGRNRILQTIKEACPKDD